STEPEPAHRYAQPGEYEVTLAVIDATGCRNAASLSLAVESLTKTLELVGGQLTLEAWPNPFNSLLRAKAAVTEAGRYRLSLLDMEGRLIWSETYQWTAGEQEAELR
ncbi:PKD domain-containing protein, partial [Arthrospira platensis SPKY1]|nr:PKD domain-containing protein [Arthrospira platensis SPKY1]